MIMFVFCCRIKVAATDRHQEDSTEKTCAAFAEEVVENVGMRQQSAFFREEQYEGG